VSFSLPLIRASYFRRDLPDCGIIAGGRRTLDGTISIFPVKVRGDTTKENDHERD
jgi:hypothetical protein